MRILFVLLLTIQVSRAELRFAIVGDRTGGANQKVYEQVWEEIARQKPAFAINVGDTIEGLHDDLAPGQWRELRKLWTVPFFFTPGNHDIWSAASETLYQQETKHPLHYSFTFEHLVHITVLDNSRTNTLSDTELKFLEKDLQAAPPDIPRLVFFHVPFWIVPISFGSGAFELHRIAKQYGVSAVVSGHTHQFVKFQRDGIQYLDAGSSGASLARGLNSGLGAKDGWSYGWTLCTVRGMQVEFNWRETR